MGFYCLKITIQNFSWFLFIRLLEHNVANFSCWENLSVKNYGSPALRTVKVVKTNICILMGNRKTCF